ncbi:MAG: RnfABCDGE type electron transport complex subunit D, partial [Clostridia bacterium]
MEQLVYSSSPHIKSGRTTKKIMIDVCIALVPACIMGCVFFGWNALLTLAIAVISAVVCEFVYRLCCKVSFKQIVQEFDFTSLVTGILVGMNMPANIDWYVPMLASFFAIAVVKMLFGGTGKNFVNPAIAGRIFVFISFSAMLKPAQALIGSISGDVVSTGATALQNIFKPGTVSGLTNLDLFLGTGVAGVLGETCKVALLLGG